MANPYENNSMPDPFAEHVSEPKKEEHNGDQKEEKDQPFVSTTNTRSTFNDTAQKTSPLHKQTPESYGNNFHAAPAISEEAAIDPASSVANNFYDSPPAEGKPMNNKPLSENTATTYGMGNPQGVSIDVNSASNYDEGNSLTSSISRRTSKFWTLEFYQQFFNITTRQVLLRLSNTLVPINPPDFLIDRNWHWNETVEQDIRSVGNENTHAVPLEEAGVTLSRDPDLYGPFWICTTLWMTLGIVSNIMSKIAYNRKSSHTSKWTYDFSVASVACTVMYLYCFVFGSAVWGVMKWKNLPASLVDTVCLYGYSLFIFELVAIICVIPVNVVQWLVIIIGGVWSTAYLILNFWHMWKSTLDRQWFIGLVAFVVAFHMALTFSFKFYFLHYKYENE